MISASNWLPILKGFPKKKNWIESNHNQIAESQFRFECTKGKWNYSIPPSEQPAFGIQIDTKCMQTNAYSYEQCFEQMFYLEMFSIFSIQFYSITSVEHTKCCLLIFEILFPISNLNNCHLILSNQSNWALHS